MQPSEQLTVTHKWNLKKVIKTPNTRRTAALQNSIKLSNKVNEKKNNNTISLIQNFRLVGQSNAQ